MDRRRRSVESLFLFPSLICIRSVTLLASFKSGNVQHGGRFTQVQTDCQSRPVSSSGVVDSGVLMVPVSGASSKTVLLLMLLLLVMVCSSSGD